MLRHFGPMPPQPKSPAFQPCPWNVQDWSGTEDSSDTCPDATASSAQEPFAHSFALAQVRLPHQVRQPTTAPTLPQPINSPNPPADPNTPIPWPKPKPPPPQHLLSNAGSMLPPLPAGPRLAQHQFFAVPMQSFCSRYQNRTCRRQCALHMSALQRAHAHVFALHGLPAQALMPQIARARRAGQLPGEEGGPLGVEALYATGHGDLPLPTCLPGPERYAGPEDVHCKAV